MLLETEQLLLLLQAQNVHLWRKSSSGAWQLAQIKRINIKHFPCTVGTSVCVSALFYVYNIYSVHGYLESGTNFAIQLVLNYLFQDCNAGVKTCSRYWHRSIFSAHHQIKFDLRFTDCRSTWCSELIVDQLCFVFRTFLISNLWSTICWFTITWAYSMSIWLADSDLNLQFCAKLPSMRWEWML